LSQQVSTAAARSITRKFVLLFCEPNEEGNPPDDFFPTPNMVLTKTAEQLRPAGLSGRKTEYVLDLSARFADGRLNAKDMVHDTDETIIEKLVEVRGIGTWSIPNTSLANSRRRDVFDVCTQEAGCPINWGPGDPAWHGRMDRQEHIQCEGQVGQVEIHV
jgi:DNA-3-methyladenine glycosylase II